MQESALMDWKDTEYSFSHNKITISKSIITITKLYLKDEILS